MDNQSNLKAACEFDTGTCSRLARLYVPDFFEVCVFVRRIVKCKRLVF